MALTRAASNLLARPSTAFCSWMREGMPRKLAANLTRPGGDRNKLRELLRWRQYTVVDHRVATETAGPIAITRTRLSMDDTWSVPAIEFTPADASGTTLVLADAGRATLAGEIDTLLRQKRRVVAIDPFYFGESKIDTRAFPQRQPEEAHIVVARYHAMQPGHEVSKRVAREQIGVLDLEGNRARSQFLNQPLGIRMAAEQHGSVAPARTLGVQSQNAFGDV